MAEPIRPAKGARPVPRFKITAIGEIGGRGGMREGHIRHNNSRTEIVSKVDDWLSSMDKMGDNLTIHITRETHA